MRVLAVILAVSALGCHHHVAPKVATATRWILDPDAHDWDTFCVPTGHEPGVDPSEVFALRCTSVADIRAYVRAQRLAE